MECVYYGYALKTIRELQEKNCGNVNSEVKGKVIVSSVTRGKPN
jgi:hypothetical protein